MEKVINTFLIGCDPEFSVVDTVTNTRVNVGSYGIGANPLVGSDHGGGVVELRPAPSYTVKGLLNNIKKALASSHTEGIRQFKWRAGARFNDISMGGHIHLELPMKGYHGIKSEVFDERIKACDRLTAEMEHHNILPKEECAARRVGGYGQFAAVQAAATTNGITRFEYRTPCSWLFDPRNAFIVLTAIKLAAVNPRYALDNVTGQGDDKKRWKEVVKFFRAFRKLDEDAEFVCQSIIKSTHDINLESLKAKPDEDFQPLWQKFAA
jgi:hypothetical protein